jgi:hypothetical protein
LIFSNTTAIILASACQARYYRGPMGVIQEANHTR